MMLILLADTASNEQITYWLLGVLATANFGALAYISRRINRLEASVKADSESIRAYTDGKVYDVRKRVEETYAGFKADYARQDLVAEKFHSLQNTLTQLNTTVNGFMALMNENAKNHGEVRATILGLDRRLSTVEDRNG